MVQTSASKYRRKRHPDRVKPLKPQKPAIHESRIAILVAVPVRTLIDRLIKLIYCEEPNQYRGVTEPPLPFIDGTEHL